MSKTYVSKVLRRLVAAQAKQRCGYCLSPQSITGTPTEIEHIVPESAGGLTTEANLCRTRLSSDARRLFIQVRR